MTDESFWSDADRHLVRYGGPFTLEIIEHAAGSFVFTAAGRRILDFTSGLPLAAVITSAEIEERAHERGYLISTTHVSAPRVAAVGNTVLDILERVKMDEHARTEGEFLRAGRLAIQERHPAVGDVARA